MIEIVDAIGYAGVATATSFMLPQVYKTYKTKSVEDISWGMVSILFLNGALWLIYGLLTATIPLILANSVGMIVCGAQIIMKILYRNNP